MKIDDYYQALVGTVCREMEVDENSLFHSGKEKDVDARYVLVQLLVQRGLSDTDISTLTGLTRQCINNLRRRYPIRSRKWSVATSFAQISKSFTRR